jgi:hypothetical protein
VTDLLHSRNRNRNTPESERALVFVYSVCICMCVCVCVCWDPNTKVPRARVQAPVGGALERGRGGRTERHFRPFAKSARAQEPVFWPRWWTGMVNSIKIVMELM